MAYDGDGLSGLMVETHIAQNQSGSTDWLGAMLAGSTLGKFGAICPN